MKRFLLLLTAASLLLTACASAEGADAASASQAVVFAPKVTVTQTAEPQPADGGSAAIDFSSLVLDDPQATPIPVDPIDKPTPTPMPEPSYWYETHESSTMGIAFSIPGTWLLNPNTNQETTIQFVEPKSEMMEQNGYQTRLTIEKVNTGLAQTASDALDRLESTLNELEGTFTAFYPGDPASVSIADGKAKGYYCYYKAEYNDGAKTYKMRGRIAIVAYEKALYQVRITAPQSWYSYYENVWRTARNTLKFL